jgi:PleD family two-component response regulator
MIAASCPTGDRPAGSAPFGASIGVAITTVPITAHALLQAADEAMYEAKHAGGNRYVTRHLPVSQDPARN